MAGGHPFPPRRDARPPTSSPATAVPPACATPAITCGPPSPRPPPTSNALPMRVAPTGSSRRYRTVGAQSGAVASIRPLWKPMKVLEGDRRVASALYYSTRVPGGIQVGSVATGGRDHRVDQVPCQAQLMDVVV